MVKRALVEINEKKCDGCGLCVPRCAEGAIAIVDGKVRLVNERYCDGLGACLGVCPRDAIKVTEKEAQPFDGSSAHEISQPRSESRLKNWPVQLNLINTKVPFFDGSSLLLMADCVPVAHPNWQRELLDDRVVLIGCPKFDDADFYVEKLNQILSLNEIRGIVTVRMEVPCCGGLEWIAKEAIKKSGKKVSLETKVLGIDGKLS